MAPIKIRLPSGLVATLRKSVPDHPWETVREGSVFVVKRQKRGDSAAWETFTNHGTREPLCLSKSDAEALVATLNDAWPSLSLAERRTPLDAAS